MKQCLAILVTVLVALWFWFGWWDRLQTHITETNAVVATLEGQGWLNVRVYPKTRGCYTWSASKDGFNRVNGSVCLESSDE